MSRQLQPSTLNHFHRCKARFAWFDQRAVESKFMNYKLPLAISAAFLSAFATHADHAPRAVLPNAIVDLRTAEGTARVNATWRYSDTHITEINHKSVGPDLKASGPPNRTFDFTPDARAKDFDDSKWEAIPPTSLEKRRSNGRLSLNWYRINLTIP